MLLRKNILVMVISPGRYYMGKGIEFNLGKNTSSGNTVFKVESGDYGIINDIVDEEFAKGYEPISIASGRDGLCFILFKKRGV